MYCNRLLCVCQCARRPEYAGPLAGGPVFPFSAFSSSFKYFSSISYKSRPLDLFSYRAKRYLSIGLLALGFLCLFLDNIIKERLCENC